MRRGPFELAGLPEEVGLEGALDRRQPRALHRRLITAQPCRQGRAGGQGDHALHQIAHLRLNVPHHRGDFFGGGAIDLVEHAQHPLAGGVGQAQRVALGRFRRLSRREDPHDGVGLDQEVAGHLFVRGAQGIEPRCVDDLHPAQRLHRSEDLDLANGRGIVVIEGAQECSHGVAAELADPAVVIDGPATARSEAQDVDGRGGGGDPDRRDRGAGQGVHEG